MADQDDRDDRRRGDDPAGPKGPDEDRDRRWLNLLAGSAEQVGDTQAQGASTLPDDVQSQAVVVRNLLIDRALGQGRLETLQQRDMRDDALVARLDRIDRDDARWLDGLAASGSTGLAGSSTRGDVADGEDDALARMARDALLDRALARGSLERPEAAAQRDRRLLERLSPPPAARRSSTRRATGGHWYAALADALRSFGLPRLAGSFAVLVLGTMIALRMLQPDPDDRAPVVRGTADVVIGSPSPQQAASEFARRARDEARVSATVARAADGAWDVTIDYRADSDVQAMRRLLTSVQGQDVEGLPVIVRFAAPATAK